jgi:GDP-L-fucose synthase
MLGTNLLGKINSLQEHSTIGLTTSNLGLRDPGALGRILTRDKPNVLIHSASKVGGIQANIKRPFEVLASNLSMDTHVI